MIKVAVIGADARTDCIARIAKRNGAVVSAMSDVDSPGLRRSAEYFQQGTTNVVDQVLEFVQKVRPDLVIVGPEEPLANGVVDAIQGKFGIRCFGPTQSLARLESSKSFTRNLLSRFDIPGNIEFEVFTALDGIKDYCTHLGEFVVKADGLAGGKGVKVYGDQLKSIDDAVFFANQLIESGQSVVVEEKVEGEEFSLQSLCDGDTVVDLFPVQDHKRAHEGDWGPNTGGMGSYSCADRSLPFLSAGDLAAASAINVAVARAINEETGTPYRGVLFGGFMATASGVRLLEYNCRFGDPEAINVLPLMKNNFVEICDAVASGNLAKHSVQFWDKATVCKYFVPTGYPENPKKDLPVSVELEPESDDLHFYCAKVVGADFRHMTMTGSRAIAVLGIADSVEAASELAEGGMRRIDGDGFHRSDIGTPALLRRRVAHMEELRRRKAESRGWPR